MLKAIYTNYIKIPIFLNFSTDTFSDTFDYDTEYVKPKKTVLTSIEKSERRQRMFENQRFEETIDLNRLPT